jgi:N-acetylglucosaminyldiphosphoundecaprenol N-acetyl-beta-D-mannosaminyltransferase
VWKDFIAMKMQQGSHNSILGTRVDSTTYEGAAKLIATWAQAGLAKTVCAANVHMVMEGYDKPEVQKAVNRADLVTADGVPLVWTLRALGISKATRVYGPTLMLHVCKEASHHNLPVGLYGSTPEVLAKLEHNLLEQFPGLTIAYRYSPPFRELTPQEEQEVTKAVQESGTRILFVGLGCPRQELWMDAHKGRFPTVNLGVGAAFDFHAGTVRQAPALLQTLGLEWLFRLAMEPKRLWKRYTKHNPRFVYFVLLQIFKRKVKQVSS